MGETYNVGGDNELSNLDLAKTICRLMDELKPMGRLYEKSIAFVEDRKGHDWRYAVDNSKIKNELGWMLSQDFDKMFKQTMELYL